MVAKRRLETLYITKIKHLLIPEIHDLMQLSIEARTYSYEFHPGLATDYGKLAAECQFELWSRRRGRTRGRSVLADYQ